MNSVLNIPTECPCELSGPEECQACNDRKNASIIETQQELIQKLFFENQMFRQAAKELKKENQMDKKGISVLWDEIKRFWGAENASLNEQEKAEAWEIYNVELIRKAFG